MDARKLRHFLAVAEEGSFTRAAEALHIAQPSLSQSVRSLEQELGTPLFHRLPRALRLTPAGEALVAPAHRALRAMRDAEESVHAVSGLTAGRLEVVVPRALSVYPAARLIAAFHREHPGVTVQLAEATDSADAAEKVADGAAEAGVLELSTLPPGIRTWPLVDYELHLVLPPGHPAPDGPVPREALRELPLIALPPGTVTRRILEESGAADNIRAEVRSVHTMLELVLEGVGAGLANEPYARTAAERGARTAPVEPPYRHRVGVALGPSDGTPAARAFVTVALACFGTAASG